ncbi:hypothetical protein FRC03_007628 [Tulasnella sp. 419]|nr:hypothetical protein FRC03_007628 [Tulasnella sp. 419]
MRVSKLISPTKENSVTILDLCTGTGCIPLLLTHLWPVNSARALAIDVSRDAVLLAQENAHNHRLSYYGDVDPLQEGNYIRIIQQDIFSPTFRSFLLEKRIEGKPFDILTCNPPYIPRKEYERLSPSVREFEDRRALLGEEDGDGLTFYRKLANIIAEDRDSDDRIFARGALVALEHGEGQSSSIRTIMETRTRGLVKRSEAWLDQWGKERTVVLRLNEK